MITVPNQNRGTWSFVKRHLPFSLAARELMRLCALARVGGLQKPILDVGCGDGLFWETIIREGAGDDLTGLLGIDLSEDELNLASVRLRDHGGRVLNGDICANRPLGAGENQSFSTVMANCSLEHVDDITSALRNIHDVMNDDGRFLLFVPVPGWTNTLALKRAADRVSSRLGGVIAGSLDGFFLHKHLYPADVWRFLLKGCGFEVTEILGVGCKSANRLFERFLPAAWLAFVYKVIFRRYPSGAWRGTLSRGTVNDFVRDLEAGGVIHSDLTNPELVEYFIVCKKKRTTS